MSISALKFQTHNFIRSMCDEGLVNQQFVTLESAREHPLHHDAIVRAVTAYSISSKDLFSAITVQLEQEQVDFERISELARDLYSKSCSIGAESVKYACAELVQASDRKDKHYCSLALYWTKNRFSGLRSKFETLVKMERSILNLENVQ